MRSIAILESQDLLSSTGFSCPETMWFKLVQTKEVLLNLELDLRFGSAIFGKL